MTRICSNCGLSIEPDAPIERDGWHITPFGLVMYHGDRLQLRPACASLLYAIAASAGPISRIALLNRISDTESDNLLSVQLTHLRRSLRAHNMPIPFAVLWGAARIMWSAGEGDIAPASLPARSFHSSTSTQGFPQDHGAR